MSTVVACSGGVDSTVLAYDAASSSPEGLLLVGVDYGQRHRRELRYAAATAGRLGAEYAEIDLRSVGAFLGSALTDSDADVPDGHYADDSMRATVVPGRNAILAAIIYALAASRGADSACLGCHAGDHAVYPDCRPEFVTAIAGALLLGTTWEVGDPAPLLSAPYVRRTKAEIVQIGAALDVPFAETWSCYRGGEQHCGRCGTCVERAEAFALAAVPDPTDYAAPPGA